MSGQSNPSVPFSFSGHEHDRLESSTSVGAAKSAGQVKDENDETKSLSLGPLPHPEPDPYPPTPENPDEPSVENPPDDLSLVIPTPGSPEHEFDQVNFQSTGHSDPNSPQASSFPYQPRVHSGSCQQSADPPSEGLTCSCQQLVPTSPPHLTFQLPTRDRDDSDFQESDPIPDAINQLRNRRHARPNDNRLKPDPAITTPNNVLRPRVIARPVSDLERRLTDPDVPSPVPNSTSIESTQERVTRVRSEPDVAGAARLGLPRVRRIPFPRDHARSGYHVCRDWCATNCKQMWYAAKFTFKKPKPRKDD